MSFDVFLLIPLVFQPLKYNAPHRSIWCSLASTCCCTLELLMLNVAFNAIVIKDNKLIISNLWLSINLSHKMIYISNESVNLLWIDCFWLYLLHIGSTVFIWDFMLWLDCSHWNRMAKEISLFDCKKTQKIIGITNNSCFHKNYKNCLVFYNN